MNNFLADKLGIDFRQHYAFTNQNNLGKEKIMERIKQKGKLYSPGSDDPVAKVECQITVDIDRRSGLRRWHGTLSMLEEYQPVHSAFPGQLRLQLEDGQSGTIIVDHHIIGSWGEIIHFQGSGPLE